MPQVQFVRMTQRLVALLQEHTADGYVFRTDLRLRPDPGSTNIAISTEAALQYYESLGQNWERAALIKARPVAGDRAAGDAFLAGLTPYIWRKYLDFAAIADIHSIKRQIHDHRGHAVVAVAGHNIKLGRGGIREIEFFVQTQQLIAGGRQPELRGRRTLDMLKALAKFGWIDAATRDELAAAYATLREIEHCLQMINDAQTHTLPDDAEELAVIARMAGYRNTAAFEKAVAKTLTTVRDRYAALFETAPSLTSAIGSLSFTGDADDPETLATLTALGYRNPAEVSRTVRGWHFGRYPATRSASARERLTEFVPVLLEALAGGEGADAAFAAFDRFLARMPAGVQLFSLLQTNTGLLNLLVTVLARGAAAGGDHRAPRPCDGRAARPGFLRLGARRGGAARTAGGVAGRGARLRGRARPCPHLRPGAAVPHRRSRARRLDRRAPGRLCLQRRRRRADRGGVRRHASANSSERTARSSAAPWHSSPWASSEGAR